MTEAPYRQGDGRWGRHASTQTGGRFSGYRMADFPYLVTVHSLSSEI